MERGKRSKTDILPFPFVKNRLLLNKEENFFAQKCPYLYKGRTCTFIESQYSITLCALAFFYYLWWLDTRFIIMFGEHHEST